ncbi:MAG: DUF4160 domain-containing protein [Chloroflexi bacterium]|nr:MAG: DUF4160 domain-containing protein [Chloroflexota bacterium]MBL1196156.1 DUF4160 domain-containing protein [Chloroflexota bacterium]NOH13449.1 DUF4160 domain-containing protein [Chloroflexota bacterium]
MSPTILREGPHRFFFYSNEGLEPPHIHVESAEKTAKFWLSPVELARSNRYNATELRELQDIIQKHERDFIDHWNKFFS